MPPKKRIRLIAGHNDGSHKKTALNAPKAALEISDPHSSSPTFPNIFDKESRYPIFSLICKLLPIDAIIALTKTYKALSKL